eukprot:6190928-Pleurochrysis_carterae.AAC.2
MRLCLSAGACERRRACILSLPRSGETKARSAAAARRRVARRVLAAAVSRCEQNAAGGVCAPVACPCHGARASVLC